MSKPTFWLHEDGRHIYWNHDCIPFDVSGLDEDQAADTRRLEAMPDCLPLNPEYGWTVVSTEPITVTPSLLCRRCGTHGFITNGAWVSA